MEFIDLDGHFSKIKICDFFSTKCLSCRWKLTQKNGNENFSWVIFYSVFVGHTSIGIALGSDISSQNQKKTKKRFLSCVWRFGNEKNHRWKKKRAEKETKEKRERTTRHTIFKRSLNFFLPKRTIDGRKKRATNINVATFFSFEDWSNSLLKQDVFWILMLI